MTTDRKKDVDALRPRVPAWAPPDFDHAGASLASIFEGQAERHRDRPAVVSGKDRLSFGELNQAANRIADALLTRLRPEDTTVALLFRPGTSIVAAIVGALKAGKIYVALDPSYPEARIAYMLNDSQAKVVVTDTEHVGLARQLATEGQDVLDVDAIEVGTIVANPDPSALGETGAFLLYTSGSTGNPKGVLHSHRNVLIEIRNYTADAHISPADRLSVWHSFSFANSVRNLYGALLNGGAVFPYDVPAQGLMPLPDWIRKHEITMIHTLATTFRGLVDVVPDDLTFPSVRVLRLGGEAITGDDVRKFKRHFPPSCVLMHVMGPTETFSIRRCFIGHDWTGADGRVPVGYPVADKEVLLLDEGGKRVGPGEVGEIVVRSKYLAVGYWRQPELTQASFVPDPDGGEARLYFTGDLGTMRSDGCLTHLGRKDFQVKIRGHRIETGEIEAALARVDSIKAAVVHAQPDGRGELRLVAYVIAAPGKTAVVSELRQELGRTLPDVMVPSSFVFLEEFPLLPNGKLNRRALPNPPVERPTLRQPYVPPRHPLEWQIVRIWRELLGVPRVGVFDDFFDLGGHSLLAAQLLRRLEDEVGCRLPLTILLSASTVSELAIAVQREEPLGMDLVAPLRTSGAEPPLFFFHGDYYGGGFYTRALAKSLSPEQPFYAVHPHSLTERGVPDSMTAMVTELVAAIRGARPHGPYRLGGYCNGGRFAFEVARRLVDEGERVEGLVIIDTSARNARFRLLNWLAHAWAWLARLDGWAEAALFLNMRDRAEAALRAVDRRPPRVAPPAGSPEALARLSGVEMDDDDDLRRDTEHVPWAETPDVTRFRLIASAHVPGRYAGALTLLVSDERRSLRSDLWWLLVADRVEVRTVPGAHLNSITEHTAEVADQLQACLTRAAHAARGQ